MTINFELLDAAIEDAATGAHGYVHYQGDWLSVPADAPSDRKHECGTALCLAGFIGVRAGAKIPAPKWSSHVGEWFFPVWTVDPETGEYLDDAAWDDAVDIATFAEDKAGLTSPQAYALFRGDNALDEIRDMRDHLREHPEATYSELMIASGRHVEDDTDD